MITLNHIGVAVESPEARSKLEKLFSLLNVKKTHEEKVADQGVKVHFLPLTAELGPPQIELLEVEDPEGTVAKFIAKRGAGIHHLSFLLKTGDLEPLCQKLVAEGIRLTYTSPKVGAHHMRINFIHPQSAGGILIELMEKA